MNQGQAAGAGGRREGNIFHMSFSISHFSFGPLVSETPRPY
jgi:hypothetical protein